MKDPLNDSSEFIQTSSTFYKSLFSQSAVDYWRKYTYQDNVYQTICSSFYVFIL